MRFHYEMSLPTSLDGMINSRAVATSNDAILFCRFEIYALMVLCYAPPIDR